MARYHNLYNGRKSGSALSRHRVFPSGNDYSTKASVPPCGAYSWTAFRKDSLFQTEHRRSHALLRSPGTKLQAGHPITCQPHPEQADVRQTAQQLLSPPFPGLCGEAQADRRANPGRYGFRPLHPAPRLLPGPILLYRPAAQAFRPFPFPADVFLYSMLPFPSVPS